MRSYEGWTFDVTRATNALSRTTEAQGILGVLRLLLAFCVIISHSAPVFGFTGIGGAGVSAFFIVSGFYMSLVLTTKYQGRMATFYANRALRLFPSYWAVIIVTVVLGLVPFGDGGFLTRVISAAAHSVIRSAGSSEISWIAAIPNIFIVGSDLVRTIGYSAEGGVLVLREYGVQLAAGFRGGEDFLFLPPIWSVSNEIVFYAFAPFIVRLRATALLALFAASLALRYFGSFGLAWSNLFPWTNLMLFLLGIVGHRAMPAVANLSPLPKALLAAIPFAVAVGWQAIPWSKSPAINDLIWPVFAFGLPGLFLLTSRWKWDTAVGELSYPVYLLHWLFAWAALASFGALAAPLVLFISCMLGYALIVLVERPIERWRHLLVTRALSQ